eukprot:TRINITY_DN62862_c0_g1_i2.p1 TRINITY_DN62862_c0_g1~~TRINITY_DN62862_c0_g1_i2.p1  ORF type:complete len:959 (-),score=151.37 TRINITY_DN62862_c0_g1_i2:195-3071(-)
MAKTSPLRPATDFLFKTAEEELDVSAAITNLLKNHPDVSADVLISLLEELKAGGISGGGAPESVPRRRLRTGKKWVYFFSKGLSEGRADMKDLLGGKGANLAEMAKLGLPVPPGFTITTQVCDMYHQLGNKYPTELDGQVKECIAKLEKLTEKQFGSETNPLLVSVRSGAAISMPGMMDTVLNLGLNDSAVVGLAKLTNNERFAWDSYRRFIQMFGNVVQGIDGGMFEEALTGQKEKKGVKEDTELGAEELKALVAEYKQIYKKAVNHDFPQKPEEQLWDAITAVFGSWNNARAIKYREINEIKGLLGTAVNVQTMVFGNMGDTSATGVCFTRNPSTGQNKFYGEWLCNAQGEDVVAGIRTPQQISKELSQEWAVSMGISEEDRAKKFPSMEEAFPQMYTELVAAKDQLLHHYSDMQDMEFTCEAGKLFMLQTRTGKRTALAAVKIAVDLCHEGLIDKATALSRINAKQLHQLLHPLIDPRIKVKAIAKGLPASPGVAVGKVVFCAAEAEKWHNNGEKVILVRTETSPEDIAGMHVSQGIMTARGGMTSHAAVVARGMGTPCVAGCAELHIKGENDAEECTIAGNKVAKGDFLTLNGNTGEVILGALPLIQPDAESGELKEVLSWCSEYKKLGVRTNADTPKDAKTALSFGAEGIGLCRTEHMFFDPTRITAVREMILADNLDARLKALDKLAPFQKQDFKDLLTITAGKPVTIRLLDPPLHEFLPKETSEMEKLGTNMGLSVEQVKNRIDSLHESNPMLGHRGCRLAITYPEIYDMQARAILEAAAEVAKEAKLRNPTPVEIMIPLVGEVEELRILKKNVVHVADQVQAELGVSIPYRVGTMIEVPRAAFIADKIAEEAEFFSFGTNDLTQMTCGFSRDDAGAFLKDYIKQGIFDKDPFQVCSCGSYLLSLVFGSGRATSPFNNNGLCNPKGSAASWAQHPNRPARMDRGRHFKQDR